MTENEVGSRGKRSSSNEKIPTFLAFFIILLLLGIIAFTALIIQKQFFSKTYTPLELELKAVKQQIKREPKNEGLRLQLGYIYYRMDKKEKALTEYMKVTEMNKKNPVAHYNIALVYIDKDQIDKAIKELESVVKYDPEQHNAYNKIGELYHKKKEYDEAKENFLKAIEIESIISTYHLNLGKTLKAQGDNEGAINEFGEALKFSPEDTEVKKEIEGMK